VITLSPSAVTVPEPINIFTCTPNLLQWWLQRLRMWVVRWPRWFANRIFSREPHATSLKRLNILYTAAWLRVNRFPRHPDWPREPRPYRFMLFSSNFAGGWDPYRQAYLDTLPQGIKTLWGHSTTYPGYPRRHTRYVTEDWLRFRLPSPHHYYYAYSGFAPNDIRAALRLYRELTAVALAPPADENRAIRRASLRRLAAIAQDCLAGTEPGSVTPGAVFGSRAATGLSGFASLVPILPGMEDDVRHALHRLGAAEHSPFRHVPGTHFARLGVLDRRRAAFHPKRTIELRTSWLMLVVDFDGAFGLDEGRARRIDAGEVRRYAREMDHQPALRQVWSHCYGFNAFTPLEDLLAPSVVERFVYFRDYPDTTLREISAAVKVQRRFVTMVKNDELSDDAAIERLVAELRERLARRIPEPDPALP
jgi:hypothetical protein